MAKIKDITFVKSDQQDCLINIFMLIQYFLKSPYLKLSFILVLFVFQLNTNAQSFGSRSAYEKRWSLLHPFAALKIKSIYKQVLPYYKSVKQNAELDQFENGGQLDAFRHVFFMAAFSQKVKAHAVKKLGIAHEKGNHKHFLQSITEEGELPDSLSTVMDLANNESGIAIGKNNPELNFESLKNKVLLEIKSGKALYFKRNSAGDYLTCDNKIIDLSQFKKKWSIPKCLIKTNE